MRCTRGGSIRHVRYMAGRTQFAHADRRNVCKSEVRMPTFSQLPSGKWRVQVRRRGLYRAATFEKKSEARDWAAAIESQANHVNTGAYAPVPKGSPVADL